MDEARLTLGDTEILLRHSARARRLVLRVDPALCCPVLTVPPGVSARDIEGFLSGQSHWMARQMARLPQRVRLEPGARIPFRGTETLIRHDPLAPRRPRAAGDEIRLGGPEEQLEARLLRWLKAEARTDLTERAHTHAARLGVGIGGISVRDTRSRWGSCSPSGRLSFTWRLILAPEAVCDYVVAHEVAHRREMNHGPRFWALVERLVGDHVRERSWLRTHGPKLFAVGPPRISSATRDAVKMPAS